MIYLGYDPGGVKMANGVAMISCKDSAITYMTACVCSVDEAQEWFREQLAGQEPAGAGIDSFLFWESGLGGWRGADRWLRVTYPTVRDSVLCSNSAYGAMAVQGMALAMSLRVEWPAIILAEAHPKVLYYALTGSRYNWPSEMGTWLQAELGGPQRPKIKTEHEWDALLSAWAAMKGHTKAWQSDLRTLSLRAIEPAGQVSYPWP